MDKKICFIIIIICIAIIMFTVYNYKKEYMQNVSTCPCSNNKTIINSIGSCKCNNVDELVQQTHKCPADRTYGIVPPLLVEPRIILTDNSMNCGKKDYTGPDGYIDDEISKYETNLEPTARIYIDNSYSMANMNTGLPPLVTRNMDTCLAKKLIK
jgi:hypothetical protein